MILFITYYWFDFRETSYCLVVFWLSCKIILFGNVLIFVQLHTDWWCLNFRATWSCSVVFLLSCNMIMFCGVLTFVQHDYVWWLFDFWKISFCLNDYVFKWNNIFIIKSYLLWIRYNKLIIKTQILIIVVIVPLIVLNNLSNNVYKYLKLHF